MAQNMAATASPSQNGAQDDDEDDYMSMSMTITEPSLPAVKETYTQRRLRKQRESEIRGRTKSKAELEADEAVAREAALSTSLLADPAAASSNKGLKMMAKMGFQPGKALGSEGNTEARTEPLVVNVKDGRGGVGLDEERKRKFREEAEREGKRVKVEEGEYRERMRREREEARLESQVGGAMRVAERMAEEDEGMGNEGDEQGNVDGMKKRTISTRPLKQINVLWRGLVRGREEKERDRSMRYDLSQSISRLPTYEDPDEEKDEKIAMGKESVLHSVVEDLEEGDPELDAFNALPPEERLQKLVEYLRSEYYYCFWCKCRYPDKEMEGCPGVTEEDHE